MPTKPSAPSFTLTGSGTLAVDGQPPVNCTFTLTGNPTALPVPTITTAALPSGTVGTPYSASLAATGGTPPYSWSLASGSLPSGLSLSAAGVISGTPLAAGGLSPTVRVQDSLGSVTTKVLLVDVVAAAALAILTSATLPAAQAGVPYTVTLQGSGGALGYTWSLAGGSLPTGLTLSAAGVISGTPTASGSFTPTLRLTDGVGSTTTKTFTLAVAAAIAPLQVFPPPTQTVQTSGSTAVVTYPPATTTGGQAPITLSYSNPSGSTFPVGTTTVTVTAQSADGQIATATFSVVVQAIVLPTVLGITRVGPTPTAGPTVAWTVSFSVPVTGVTLGAFTLAVTGLTGAALQSLSGSGATYTVTAGVGTGSGSLALNLTTIGGIVDSLNQPLTATFAGQAYSVNTVGTPLTQNVHPRLLLNSTETPAFALRASTGGEWHSEFQTFVNTVQAYWTLDPTSLAAYRVARLAMSAAYIYQLFPFLSGVTFGAASNTQAAWGAKGREWLLAYKTVDPTLGQAEWPPARCAIYATDWLWPVLTVSDRTALLTFFKQIDEDAWIAPYTSDAVALLGAAQQNWGNNQHQQAWSLKIMAGLVFAAAGIDDTWASYSYQAYTIVARHAGAGWISMETQRGGTDGSWSMGLIYGISYEQFPMIHCEAAWRTANGLTRAAHYTAAEAGNVLGMPIYGGLHIRAWGAANSLTPRGAMTMGLKDFHTGWTGDFNQGDYSICGGFALVASELDGVDQNRADFARYLRTHFFEEANDPEVWILTRFLGPKGTEKTAAQAGIASVYPMAMGEWHVTSGIHRSLNESQVALYGHKFSHDSGCAGHFSIDYMGPVIVTPGVGGHDRDASWAYGFVNMLGAPEEGRTTPESPLEGIIACEDMGFKRIYQSGTENLVPGTLGDWNDLSLARFHVPQGNERAAYLFLDQRRNYNSDLINDNAITSQSVKWVDPTRQFIVISPTTPGVDSLKVWMLDRGSVKPHTPPFHRRLVFYLTGDPTIDGTPSVGPSRGIAGTDGKTTYTGATRVDLAQTSTGMNNHLWLRVYAPTAYQIVKVHFRRGVDERTVEDAYGQVFDEASMGGDATLARPYAGSYRIEVIPTVANISETFLTGIEVTPAAGAESPRAQLTTTGNFLSERIGTDIVVIATVAGASAGSVVLPDLTGTVRVVWADLPVSAARTFSKGANLGTVTHVATGDTDLTYTSSAQGTLELTVTITAGGSAASRTLTVS